MPRASRKTKPVPADLTWPGGIRTDEAIEARVRALSKATTADAMSGLVDDEGNLLPPEELIPAFEIQGVDIHAVQFPESVIAETDRLLFILPMLDMDLQRAVHALYPDLGPLSVRVKAASLAADKDFLTEYSRVANVAASQARSQIENLGLRRMHHVIANGKDSDAVSAYKAVAATKIDITTTVKPGEEFLAMLQRVGEAEAAAYRAGYEDARPVDAIEVGSAPAPAPAPTTDEAPSHSLAPPTPRTR